MIAALALSLSMALGAGSADELASTTVGALKLQAPAAWQRRGEGASIRFAAPSGEAYFDMDVGQVQRKGGMPAAECLKKILAGVGPKGFKKTKIGGQPAAVREYVDSDESGKKFVQLMYLGCNGTTTWSMSFHMVEEKRARFAPLAEQISRSIEY